MRVYSKDTVVGFIALTAALALNFAVLFGDLKDKETDVFSLFSVLILMFGTGWIVYMLSTGGIDIEGRDNGDDNDSLPSEGRSNEAHV